MKAKGNKKEKLKDKKSGGKGSKIKILVYGDSPACATGFGQVVRNIFRRLVKTGRYDIDIFGINDRGVWKDPEEHPYRIYPAMRVGDTDFYGRIRFINVLRGGDTDLKPPWDIIFTLQDPFILEQRLPIFDRGLMSIIMDIFYNLYRKKTDPSYWWKVVSYWPIDSYLKPNWVEQAIGLPNYTVAYTHYGKREIEKANNQLTKPLDFDIKVIYHGVDTDTFKPIDEERKKEFRRRFFKGRVKPGTFLLTCVARNQMRKDIPRVMMIFKEFQRRRPDSFLYIHAKETDVHGSLREYANYFNLEYGKDWSVPARFDENVGFPIESLNMIYNVSDAHILATLGEGWGLPLVEAMATRTINLAPNITSIPEIFNTVGRDAVEVEELGKDTSIRGIPLKAHTTSSEWATYGPMDFERIRPLTNVDDAVAKLLWVYDNREKVEEIEERAYRWVQGISWKKIVRQWDELFQQVYRDLEEERKNPEVYREDIGGGIGGKVGRQVEQGSGELKDTSLKI